MPRGSKENHRDIQHGDLEYDEYDFEGDERYDHDD